MSNGNATNLDGRLETANEARHEAVKQVLQDPVMASIIRDSFERHGYPQDSFFDTITSACDEVQDMYKNTNATASECFDLLQDRLLETDAEPDCVSLWQVLAKFKHEEEEWDTLTPEEQATKDSVPKGKQRKPLSSAAAATNKRAPTVKKQKACSIKKAKVQRKHRSP